MRTTRIPGCSIEIPSFPASFGAEKGFNPQPYSRKIPKNPLFPHISLCRAAPAAPPKAAQNGIFRLYPGIQYSRPCCPAAAAGTCSRSVFSRRSCLGFMAQTPPSCFTRNAEPRITAWEAPKIPGIHLPPFPRAPSTKESLTSSPFSKPAPVFPTFSPLFSHLVQGVVKKTGNLGWVRGFFWDVLVSNREGC